VKVKKSELGRGIAALLGNIESEVNKSPEAAKEIVRELSHTTANVLLDHIETNPWQPRNAFDSQALEELAASIKVHGLIQPVTLRRLAHNQYQLISGERRFRASKIAELTEIPAYIRLANDQEMLEMALIENIQREELNPIEIATTYQRLIDECNLTHEQMSERVSKNRSTITNSLRLLKLEPDIKKSIKEGKVSTGHAKILVGIDDLAFRISLHQTILKEQISVRALEELAKNYAEQKLNKNSKTQKPEVETNIHYKAAVQQFNSFFGSKVNFKRKSDGSGNITINFKSEEDFQRLLECVEDDKK